MLKVGISKIETSTGEKPLDYHSVPHTVKGYADVEKYTPADCDLLYLLLEDGRKKMGWWTGQSYFGLRLRPEDKIIGWKKCKDLS